MATIADIKEHLEALNLNSTRMPSMKEYKKAYRELMKLHPDLGGNTTRFQEITLAARMIFEFVTTHQGEQTRVDNEADTDLLQAFMASNNVNYNNGNIVFNIDPAESSLWVECVTKRLGKPLPLENGNALQFKMEDFRIPRQSTSTKTNYGNVTVTIWPNPKTTHPKAMVQGKCHIAFVTFILTLVIKDIKAASKLPLQAGTLELAVGSDEELEDEERNVGDSGVITKALGRLEKELLNMRDDMAERMDAALEHRAATDNIQLDKRLEYLECLLKADIEQHSKLSTSIDNLTDSVKKNEIQLGSEQIELLARGISSSHRSEITALCTSVSALRSEMAKADTLSVIDGKVDSMATVLDQVHSAALIFVYCSQANSSYVTRTGLDAFCDLL